MERWDRQVRRPSRRLLVVVGALLTLAAAAYVVRAPTVYWSQTDVVFLTPTPTSGANTLQATQTDAIAMAGVVQRAVMGHPEAQVASDDVTIVGQGLTTGTWVRLVNSGGQWTNNFDRAVLDVQVADSSPAAVRRRQWAAVQAIAAALDQRQVAAGVLPERRYTLLSSPADPPVRQETGHRQLALVLTLALGAAGTSGAVAVAGLRTRRTTTWVRAA